MRPNQRQERLEPEPAPRGQPAPWSRRLAPALFSAGLAVLLTAVLDGVRGWQAEAPAGTVTVGGPAEAHAAVPAMTGVEAPAMSPAPTAAAAPATAAMPLWAAPRPAPAAAAMQTASAETGRAADGAAAVRRPRAEPLPAAQTTRPAPMPAAGAPRERASRPPVTAVPAPLPAPALASAPVRAADPATEALGPLPDAEPATEAIATLPAAESPPVRALGVVEIIHELAAGQIELLVDGQVARSVRIGSGEAPVREPARIRFGLPPGAHRVVVRVRSPRHAGAANATWNSSWDPGAFRARTFVVSALGRDLVILP